MKKMIAIAALIIGFAAYSFAAFAEETKPADKISDEEFLQKMSDGIKAYSEKQPEVKRIGWGTCRILMSDKPSKNKYRGFGDDIEIIMPRRKPLFMVIAAEAKKPRPEKTVPTVWIAWRDHDGQLNLAFNARIEAYECSTIWEVQDIAHRSWRAWNTHTLEELNGFQRDKKPWVTRETPEFGWIIFGFGDKTVNLKDQLAALTDLKILSEVKVAE